MSKILFIKNEKGGTGKSTISKNIALGMAAGEYKTALLSFDHQNGSLILMGKRYTHGDPGVKALIKGDDYSFINIRENLYYYPLENKTFSTGAKASLGKTLENLKSKFDIVIIDGPPQETTLSKFAAEFCDEILVPIKLDNLSIEGIAMMMRSNIHEKIEYIVPNLSDGRKPELKIYDELKEFLEDTSVYLSEAIPNSAIETNLASKGKGIFDTEAKKAEGIQKIYLSIMNEIVGG